MPSSVTSNLSRKRQYPKPHQSDRSRFRKRQKLEASASAYWDNLSKIWLTKDALEELDRRNSRPKPPQNHRPLTRRFHAELKKHSQGPGVENDAQVPLHQQAQIRRVPPSPRAPHPIIVTSSRI
ncbi:hypothetical protein ACJ73_03700 [Blastomyces percursus]|uniref:Uncharacterized protein n=1 Tax=Blastomyces percursus TaxID=1658174 RepID=A0A1J9QXH8_9EURO|nr:hypothetical protein ACJ73_03700 [Blastomyces percursus]